MRVGFPELPEPAASPPDPLFSPSPPSRSPPRSSPLRPAPRLQPPPARGRAPPGAPRAPPATAGAPAAEDKGKAKPAHIGGKKSSLACATSLSLLPSSARWEGWLPPASRDARGAVRRGAASGSASGAADRGPPPPPPGALDGSRETPGREPCSRGKLASDSLRKRKAKQSTGKGKGENRGNYKNKQTNKK